MEDAQEWESCKVCLTSSMEVHHQTKRAVVSWLVDSDGNIPIWACDGPV